ncbi:Endonuclease/exonuclease/phosphatase, partial [Syncephalis fuscata]
LDLSAEAYLIADTTREEMWCGAIETTLNQSPDKYVKIISRQLIGMLIVVYVKCSISDQVREVTSASIGCGLMGMMGNKGAVAVRLRIKDSYLCFINSHLAADTYQVERRKQNYWEIVRRASFPNLALMSGLQRMSSYTSSNLTGYLPGSSQRYFGVFDNDHLIWMGDLNYRVAMSGSEVKKHLGSGNIEIALTYDQLINERRLKNVFDGFDEGNITFMPTYKYDVGTNVFDTSEKQRTPSWCDRILWRSRTGASKYIQQLSYTSHPELLASDHKPVSADFEIQVNRMNIEITDVHGSIIRELDKYENECMPDVSVSRLQIDFGEIKYEQPVTETIVIENVGQVTAQCRFIPKFEEVNICKPWLWVNPPTAMLVPGDKAIISMTLLVDAMSAPPLNAGEDALEDILILHLDNGKDFFVSVSASYVPTCFATSLDRLTRLPHPVRAVPVAEVELLLSENQLSMPRELWRIIDYLQMHGQNMDGLFMQAGNPYLIAYIRDCLDTGVEFEFNTLLEESVWPSGETLPLSGEALSSSEVMMASVSSDNSNANGDITRLMPAHSIHAMAETLLRFLEAMPEPVIPYDHYQRCLDASHYDKETALQVESLLIIISDYYVAN